MRTPTKFKVYVTLLWIGVVEVVVGDDCVVVVLVAATLIIAEVDDVLRLGKAYGLTE